MRIKWKKRNRKTITKRCLITRLPYFFQLYIYIFLLSFFSSKIENYKIIREVERYLTIWPIGFQTKNHHHHPQLNLIEERIEIFLLRFKSANEINPCNYFTTCTQQAYKWGNVLRHQQKNYFLIWYMGGISYIN